MVIFLIRGRQLQKPKITCSALFKHWLSVRFSCHFNRVETNKETRCGVENAKMLAKTRSSFTLIFCKKTQYLSLEIRIQMKSQDSTKQKFQFQKRFQRKSGTAKAQWYISQILQQLPALHLYWVGLMWWDFVLCL